MLYLAECLQNQDLGYLEIVAELWEIHLESDDLRAIIPQLADVILAPQRIEQMVLSLPDEARRGLDDVSLSGGKLVWSLFTRRHGEVREMGAGRRDREHPHLSPVSAAEMLWYRALIGRAFFDSPDGPQEYAFIPEDILNQLPAPQPVEGVFLGRPALPAECAVALPHTNRILDHATTLLAALRQEFPADKLDQLAKAWQPAGVITPYSLTRPALGKLLASAGLLDANGFPSPESTRHFLELPRDKALAHLARSWIHSTQFNELDLLPGLSREGEWQNDPLKARYAILDFIKRVPPHTWWSLNAFVQAIHEEQPDFQRPAGDYDSWYIRDQESEQFLRGFENWDRVDGAVIRYTLLGPLHWLGILGLAAPGADAPPAAFRFSAWADALLMGTPPEGVEDEDESFLVSSDARIRVPRLVPRTARYQLARFSEWEEEREDAYLYRLTPASLERAREQGLRVIHLLTLLRKYALTVPPSLVKALERWQEAGSEAHMERVLILRLKTPEMLQVLRASRAARFLGEPLGPTTIIVKSGAKDKVLGILAEMGYLGETDPET
jgi:hypothetical protein